ncbi:MAG TPA: HD domain-containing protein [Syntrophothermus lipocalidus]|uniref:HD domain-containing protein n=1 Tax=Syntrophothermus lipocalidus TaxID=86170 RepID=UPI0002E4C22B|nr:HD domain-containing protein [Syntrophothermus lipocalidus]HHV76884.1 HD domain-containing protein [Syntrophothermus lipocalidus]HOV43025.1 HD domain-containing protein [Syntrophothermus lipocalidus]
MVTLEEVRQSAIVDAFIRKGNEHLGVLGYTDHGYDHVTLVAERAYTILKKLGVSEREAELAAIAGYLHDIGNVINRVGHSQSGALMSLHILRAMGMPAEEISVVAAAIGNHDEGSGHPINRVAAALILADKSHVHRSRVRNPDISTFDIHDRVNYAVEEASLRVNEENMTITMDLVIDINICPVMEYFEIFLSRMVMCRRAADFLGCEFELIINGAKLL